MEKGANNCSGFCVSDKKSSFNSDVSLMKLQSTEPLFPSKICMMACHEENNLDRFCGSVGDDGGGGGDGTNGGSLGPSNCNSGGANEVVGDIYLDNVSSSRDGGEKFARSTNLQPFDISPYYSTTPNKYPVGMMARVSFPFTTAQWKELERQAMIYKYMIASVPVPPDLLFPLSRNFADSSTTLTASGGGAIYNVRYSKNGDPEPGRCKRTDGKKWRCSRDVAPHQKYCERHLHRGRPRSRKPVEVKNNGETQKKTRLEQCPLPTVQANSNTSQQFTAAYEPQLFNPKTELSISSPSYKETSRDMGLIIEGEMVALDGAEQQWQHLMEAQIELTNESSSIYNFHQDYLEHQPLNLLSYSNFSGQEIEAPPSGFIDAWSIDNPNISSNNGNAEASLSPDQSNLSPSLNLSMAMAAGNLLDEEMRKIQMGNGVKDCNDHKTKDSRYLGPVSWEPFARGGPLGEALQPGSVAVGGSNPTSPYRSISSTPATTVSSPSGVLHRTLFSHSDSSVCNSPTLAAPPSDIPFQWLN